MSIPLIVSLVLIVLSLIVAVFGLGKQSIAHAYMSIILLGLAIAILVFENLT